MFGRAMIETGSTTPRRSVRTGVTVAILLALLAPVVLDRDSHPLSTFPMYARTRSNIVTFVTAQSVDERGQRSALSLATIGASDDPLVVAGELRAAIANGDADRRCREIADRVFRTARPVEPGVVEPGVVEPGVVEPGVVEPGVVEPGVVEPVFVEVVTERHDTIAASADEPSLLERRLHARCEVAP